MVTLTYHIRPAAGQAFESDTRCLLLEAGSGKLSILLWDKTRGIPEAAEVFSGITDWDEQWEEMMQQSELLGYRSLDTLVFINTVRFIPVPSVFYHPADAVHQLEALFGEAAYQHTGGDIIPFEDMVVAWQAPADLFNRITGHFERVQVKSLASLIIENGSGEKQENGAGHLLVSGKIAWLACWRDGKLLIIKTTGTEQPETLAYHMLNICKQWGIPNDKINWEVSGMVNTDSPLWEAAFRYFEHLQPSDPGQPFGNEIPGHFFAHQVRFLRKATLA